MPMVRFSPARAAFVLCGICAAFVVLAGRVLYLQTYGRGQTLHRADRQQYQRQVLRARRGSIYDRNGIEMAGTVQTQAVFVDPKFMQQCFQKDGRSLVEMDQAVAKLAKVLDKEPFELSQLLSDRFDSRYVKVAERVDEETCENVRRLNLPGVGVSPSDVRHYPMGSIAAHVLGGCGYGGRGLEGLELKFDTTLAGRDGYSRAAKDAQHRPIAVAAEDYLPPQHGRHVMLTIDANVQMIAEQELAETCRMHKAKRGEAVVMDPYTGEVLALANWPAFHPQNLEDTASMPERRRNNALVSPYEPGSTLKPFIVGPALQAEVTRMTEVWPIPGQKWKTSYGRTITDVHGYPPLSTWDGMVKSSNILTAMLATRMGNARLHQALSGWGFGQPTGVELPGEDPGLLNPLKKWSKHSTDSVAQGYEIMVTPVQLCRAFCAYANGGRLVKPTLVRGMLDADGQVVSRNKPTESDMLPQVLSRHTATQMRQALCDVVVRGTATKARSGTWNVFGKTGTAHVSEGRAGYSSTRYTSSFLCGAPAERPRLVAAFIIHEPDKAWAQSQNQTYYGGAVAAPGATRMLERCLAYLQVPPSPPLPLPPPDVQKVLYQFRAKAYDAPQAPAQTATARE